MLLDHKVQQGQRVHPGLGVFQGPKDQEGLEVDLEALVKKVMLGLQDFLVGMDSLGCQVHKGHRGSEELQDLQGWMGLVGLLDPSALPVLQGYLGYQRQYLHFQSLLSLLNLLLPNHPSLPNHNLPNQQRNRQRYQQRNQQKNHQRNRKALCPGRSRHLWSQLHHLVS